MNEERRNRLIAAATVNVILLIAILVAVILYQLIEIKIISKNKQDIVNEIERLQKQTQLDKNAIEYYKTEEGLVDLAYQYGFAYGK